MKKRIWQKQARELFTGLLFLLPNILGVMLFVILPVIFSIGMAFTNWDLKQHNMWKSASPNWIGLDNFIQLFQVPEFMAYFGNTLFLMMGIPLSIGAALVSALILSNDTRGGGGKVYAGTIVTVLIIASVSLLSVMGMGATGMTILIVALACGVLVLGTLGSLTVYRTLFYIPSFTAGVATYILWKKMLNPYTGPINVTLRPILDSLANMINALPASVVKSGQWVCFALIAGVLLLGVSKLRRQWADGDLGIAAVMMSLGLLFLPLIVAWRWSYTSDVAWVLFVVVGAGLLWQIVCAVRAGRDFTSTAMNGIGGGLMLALAFMVCQFILLGLGVVAFHLPAMAVDGLEPPQWLNDYNWAKPSLMAMGFWAAIGSNTMLLYLAALTNVPQELYEAADIDGAQRFSRFWNITWPQLAPTTFFITVMAVIGGLQGGFEMARTMTKGGPAGSTTTLSYFVYLEGFETGRLGYACAVAWTLFILVFCVTVFNWTFGNRYVND